MSQPSGHLLCVLWYAERRRRRAVNKLHQTGIASVLGSYVLLIANGKNASTQRSRPRNRSKRFRPAPCVPMGSFGRLLPLIGWKREELQSSPHPPK